MASLINDRKAGTSNQYAVMDKRNGNIVRTATTRTAARNKAALSKHYKVVRRTVTFSDWR